MMYAFMGVIVMTMVLQLYDLFVAGRPRHMVDRPVDIHERLYKNLSKGAGSNIEGLAPRKLMCIGEADFYDLDYGYIRGIYSGMYCDIVFVATGRLFRWFRLHWRGNSRMIFIPREILRDKHSSNLCVESNGFEPIGNFYIPVWPSTTTPEKANMMLQLCLDQEHCLIEREGVIELSEQGAHAMVDALSVKGRNKDMINRKDYLDKVPGREGGDTSDEPDDD